MSASPYRKPDRFTDAAKKAGYPARSIFKLSEIDRRVRLLKPGMHVLDLGASPGSWAKYAAEKIGRHGKLIAVDLEPLRTALPANATFLQGDALTLDPEGPIGAAAPYDVVLSDMAPNTTGSKVADQARSVELFVRALEVCDVVLKKGGAFVGKIFMGEDFPSAREEVRKRFTKHRLMKPEAVRAVSYEIFVYAEGKK
jgi:23S rRNA (uridine2552-2'-O)-methyltransferase